MYVFDLSRWIRPPNEPLFTCRRQHYTDSNFTQTYLGVVYGAEREMTLIDLELD